jgi:carbon-monoxide dehydrogenase medium subunit
MIRTALTHHAPQEVADACAVLGEHGPDAAVLGGGTMLLPAMGRGERNHAHVVDLRRLGLSGIRSAAAEWEIGAMTTYSELLRAADLDGRAALLRRAAAGITGGPQLRNQGTVGGSACYANPASDMPAVLVAIGADLRLVGPAGAREVPASAFFRDAFVTALDPGEVLTTIRVPRRPAGVGYAKLKLSESSWPIATAAAVVERDEGRVRSAVITVGAVCRTPVSVDVTDLLDGSGRLLGDAGELDTWVDQHLDRLWDDELAPADYRRQVAGVVARRALAQTEEGGAR